MRVGRLVDVWSWMGTPSDFAGCWLLAVSASASASVVSVMTLAGRQKVGGPFSLFRRRPPGSFASVTASTQAGGCQFSYIAAK